MVEFPKWLQLLKGTLTEDPDNDNQVELLLSEPIGYDEYSMDGMSARAFGSILASIPKAKKLKLNINTLGGRIDEGMAMYNMLLARANVHTHVIGYAASMGAILAQAGAHRTMAKGTMMIVHNPQGGFDSSVEAKEMDIQSEMLKKLKTNIVDILQSRTKAGKKKISDMMDSVTAMTPEEAVEAGFCDEVVGDTPAWNDLNPKKFFDTCRQLSSAPKCAVDDDSGKPATEPKQKSMKLLTAALAKLGLVSSADLTDETAIIADLQNRVTPFQAAVNEVPGLKNKLTAHEAALKLRVENRVAKAITDKLIKAERKDTLVASGLLNEANLDFLDDLVPAVVPRRGSPPLPVKPGASQAEDELSQLRDSMASEQDPQKRGDMARRCRELRGHKNLLAGCGESTKYVVIDGMAHQVSTADAAK